MSVLHIVKDAEIFLEAPGHPGRYRCRVRERRDGHLTLDCPAGLELALDEHVIVHADVRGAYWVQDARWLGGADEDFGQGHAGELELCGEPTRIENRTTLRVPVPEGALRASLAGQECELLDVSEVSFAVRTRGAWKLGDVLEAVVYDTGEALPGRVCVQSVAPLERGWKRYGLCCLDGRLKLALAGVCQGVARAEIERARTGRRRP